MIFREWLQSTLVGDLELGALVGDGVYQAGSLTTSQIAKPYLVHLVGNATDENFSEEVDLYRQFFTIYVHDVPQDYSRIDQIIPVVKRVLTNACVPAIGVIRVLYLETSKDFKSGDLGTIFRYIRFQALINTTGSNP